MPRVQLRIGGYSEGRTRGRETRGRRKEITMKTIALCAIILSAVPVWAHHSFTAEFDRNKVVNLEGTIVKMEWVNPHAWIHVAVKNPDGTTTVWMIEGNTPNGLLR